MSTLPRREARRRPAGVVDWLVDLNEEIVLGWLVEIDWLVGWSVGRLVN